MHDSTHLLPAECVGNDRVLSRELYRAAMDHHLCERPQVIFGLYPRYSMESIAEHIALLPLKAIEGIRQALTWMDDQQQLLQDSRSGSGRDPAHGEIHAPYDAIPSAWIGELRRHLYIGSSSGLE